jgi:hypothetical protein
VILIIYHRKPRTLRNAIAAHLQSFGQFGGKEIKYWNIAYRLPTLLKDCTIEGIIFHFTFFLPNINTRFTERQIEEWNILDKIDCPRSAIIQDEYINTTSICLFLKRYKVETDHPHATYEETRNVCFKDLDNKFPYYAISPRHFEAV